VGSSVLGKAEWFYYDREERDRERLEAGMSEREVGSRDVRERGG
jgi:hypothetical protein